MQYAEIRGKCKIGKLNIKDDGAIERGFKALVDQTGVDKNVPAEELFAENEAAYILKVKKCGVYFSGQKIGGTTA